MTELTPLQEALLDQGLEIETPLAEAFRDREIRAAGGGNPTVEEVSAALLELLSLGRISVWAGHWADHDPRRVEGEKAKQLLGDPRQYEFANEEKYGLDRVYYANVENIP